MVNCEWWIVDWGKKAMMVESLLSGGLMPKANVAGKY